MTWTTPFTRALNKEFASRGFRCQVSAFGSFIGVRIEDAEGNVSVKHASEIAQRAAALFVAANAITDVRPLGGITYHMDGVVMNWTRN